MLNTHNFLVDEQSAESISEEGSIINPIPADNFAPNNVQQQPQIPQSMNINININYMEHSPFSSQAICKIYFFYFFIVIENSSDSKN